MQCIVYNNKSLNRQQTVHLLPLPYEIAEYINSFCFYDSITGKIRKLKNKIIEKFYYAFISRKYPRCDWGYYEQSDCCEYWSICLSDVNVFNDTQYKHYDTQYLKMFKEKHFQAMNCKRCGNYKTSTTTGYSVYELDGAFEMGDMSYYIEIRSRMHERLRCECIIE